jgi:hypothetical protein
VTSFVSSRNEATPSAAFALPPASLPHAAAVITTLASAVAATIRRLARLGRFDRIGSSSNGRAVVVIELPTR